MLSYWISVNTRVHVGVYGNFLKRWLGHPHYVEGNCSWYLICRWYLKKKGTRSKYKMTYGVPEKKEGHQSSLITACNYTLYLTNRSQLQTFYEVHSMFLSMQYPCGQLSDHLLIWIWYLAVHYEGFHCQSSSWIWEIMKQHCCMLYKIEQNSLLQRISVKLHT